MGSASAFPQQLVEGAMGGDPAEPFPPLGKGGKVEVSRLARQVLTVGYTAHQGVEPGATIAGADRDGLASVQAQGLQHLFAERDEMRDVGLWDAVVNARRLGCAGAGKFR